MGMLQAPQACSEGAERQPYHQASISALRRMERALDHFIAFVEELDGDRGQGRNVAVREDAPEPVIPLAQFLKTLADDLHSKCETLEMLTKQLRALLY